jgi:DNA invertase Pin-like site-specific DNA recombinase
MRQVMEHQESTERQYALGQRAVALGWPSDSLVVLDEDLGQSGANGGRQGFERLVREVGMGRAGIVLSLEVSRLARNCSDWHRLLEICAVTDTLILDEEGVYDPAHFNDRLLLGLKGTMSEAELHVIRSRLQGGLLNKARRGELLLRQPIGFVYDEQGRIVLDPDKQIQESIRYVFATFQRAGTVVQTVRVFREGGLKFPQRLYHGPRKGEVVWGDLKVSRANYILHNPRYAGAYVYGRRTQKRRDAQGRPVMKWLAREDWHTLIKGLHAGYITWEQYEENLKRLEGNRQSGDGYNRCAPREGPALLQGLALCGVCGKRMGPRYRDSPGGLSPQYECKGWEAKVAGPVCQSIPGDGIDRAVGGLLVEMMNPVALEVALSVQQELEGRLDEAERLRYRQVERARQEAELARRRYLRVDPDNRLVADVLEADWNGRLRELREAEEQVERKRQEDRQVLDERMREKIRELAADFPRLWNDPRVAPRERKRMARLVLEDVTLVKEAHQIQVQVRFKAGATKTLYVPKLLTGCELWTTDKEVVAEIDRLLDQYTNSHVANILNARGLHSGKGKSFDGVRVRRLCKAYGLKSRYQRLRELGLVTREELAARQGVDRMTISKWRQQGRIKAHLADDTPQYLYEDPGGISLRLKKKKAKRSSQPGPLADSCFIQDEGGAV